MAKSKEQISFDDRIVNNPEVEEVLEEREQAKGGAKAYRQADKKAKEALAKVTETKPYRIGRFIVSETHVAGKDVQFTVDESQRVKISVVGESPDNGGAQ